MAEQAKTLDETAITREAWKKMERQSRRENLGRSWYKFTRNPLSVVGLLTVGLILFLAVFAPYVTPYPEHAGPFTDFANAKQPPSLEHPFGTDSQGKDLLAIETDGARIGAGPAVVGRVGYNVVELCIDCGHQVAPQRIALRIPHERVHRRWVP
jgi:ABC-type dipeptide/oligopeptide/nickel transport system permease subunit